MILEGSYKHHWKLDKYLRIFSPDHKLLFSVIFEYYAILCIVPIFNQKQRFHSFLALLSFSVQTALKFDL